jgi:hypothetical protein
MFSIARVEFGNTYGSNAAFVAGAELAVPVSRSVDLFLSVMRFASSGIPRVKIYAYVNAELVQVDEISEGEASYRQVNIHGGLRFNRQLGELVAISGQIGLAAALVREDARLPTGETLLEFDKTGYGFFAGVGFERRFMQSGLALFVNGGYDVIRVMVDQKLVEAGGTTVTSGIRKYF